MGKTEGKQCATKQKETEQQFGRDYIVSFLNYKALSYNKGCIQKILGPLLDEEGTAKVKQQKTKEQGNYLDKAF